MHKAVVLVALMLASVAGFSQAEIKFDKRIQKFEKVKAGEILSFDFFYVNKGDQPLIINDVKVTCGCTKPEWSKEPLLPGETATLKVTFDTKGKIGYQDRTLEVISNAKNSPATARFRGMVDHKQ